MVELVVDTASNKDRTGSAEKQPNCWSSLRAIFATMIPCCGCRISPTLIKPDILQSSLVTGTIFGRRKGRVHLCVHEDTAAPPLLLLEFTTTTYVLVKEMESGLLRMTLECKKGSNGEIDCLLNEPIWNVSCNGRKVGFAARKQNIENDPTIANFITTMQSVTTGAGVIRPEEAESEDEELIYMRATYERILGPPDSEAFHMVNPDVTPSAPGQELSIFLHRS
eukprot:c20420_g1_i1 orf=299-967(-)